MLKFYTMSKQDFTIVFGGDGTLLKTARNLTKDSLPVLGVHTGTVGFLTEVKPDKLKEALKKINNGKFTIDKRMMLIAKIYRNKKVIKSVQTLNEVAIRNTLTRLIDFTVKVDGEIFDKYRCDGLIVATPTGSTAYNYSAGGPIIDPKKNVFVLTPICPFNRQHESKLIPDKSTVSIEIDTDKRIHFAADSQIFMSLQKGDIVKIERSPNVLQLIRIK